MKKIALKSKKKKARIVKPAKSKKILHIKKPKNKNKKLKVVTKKNKIVPKTKKKIIKLKKKIIAKKTIRLC